MKQLGWLAVAGLLIVGCSRNNDVISDPGPSPDWTNGTLYVADMNQELKIL